ncbi:phage tail sheath family protein, partial [Desulfocurvibacter africanus]
GGVDAETGKRTGLELVHEVFPRLRLVPGQIVAPRFSMQAGVAIAMDAKCEGINSLFRAIALVDIDDTVVSKYADATKNKEINNLTSENLVVCWPKVSVSGVQHHLSTHLAALMASIDADNDDIPYRSPSNNRLMIEGAKAGGVDVYLGLDQANYLNGQGIITAINWDGGWKAWGNRTAAYPSVTDPKDAWIPIRRFFGWYANRLILTYFQKVDWPIRRRLIQTIVDSENVNLNGLTSREIINGGRVTFLEAENPVTDIMDGVLRFHVYLNPPAPARDIEFVLEYDPSYLQALFG